MIKGIIFDLDETLIDTSFLKKFRDRRDWKSCYENKEKTMMYNDLENFLVYIERQNIKIGIVTMSPRKYAETILSYHNINYHSLIAYHDVLHRKPHPEPMIKCMERLNLKSHELIALGDDKRDIISSNEAGILSVGVTWGSSSKNDLEAVNAKLVINEFADLVYLFQS